MKLFATVPVEVFSSRAIRRPRGVHCKISSRRSLVRRFERFIESADWDETYLRSQWIDQVCISGFFISVLYFVPVLVSLFQR
jgi:hypothetical protein